MAQIAVLSPPDSRWPEPTARRFQFDEVGTAAWRFHVLFFLTSVREKPFFLDGDRGFPASGKVPGAGYIC